MKIYQSTLGKLPSLNLNLRLVDRLPFIQVNPILLKCDFVSLILAPLVCLILVTLLLLLTKIRMLIGTQIFQIMGIISMLSGFAICTLAKDHVRKSGALICQLNSLLQSKPTNKFSNTALQHDEQGRKSNYDLPGTSLFLLVTTFNACVVLFAVFGYIGAGPLHAILEQLFGMHSNIFIDVIDSMLTVAIFEYVIAREIFNSFRWGNPLC